METEVLNFLTNRPEKLCVLATVNEKGEPECAVMGYAVLPDLSLVLSTDKTSRKWLNLRQNPFVALTFGWSFSELNIQYEGEAVLVGEGEEYKKCEEIYFSVHPEALEFKGQAETVFLKIKPTWTRLSDYRQTPARIEEKTFQT